MKLSTVLASAVLSATSVLAKRKIFIDNDGLTALNVILPLSAGMEIVGVSASFGDPSLIDALGDAYTVLGDYNMTDCVPLYAGADSPLLRTKNTFDRWGDLFGKLVWNGAWTDGYTNAYNYSDVEFDPLPAAMALVNAVREYPGEIEVYAAGLMTTVATAIKLYPTLAEEAAGLWIMGGYVDTDIAIGFPNAIPEGSLLTNDVIIDVNTDFNLIFDPEAAQIVLTANWTETFIGGNVTNYIYPTQDLYNSLISAVGSMDDIETNPKLKDLYSFIGNGNLTDIPFYLPLWDEAVSAYMAFPELVLNYTDVYVQIDTSFYSSTYGRLRLVPEEWIAPNGIAVGKAKYVNTLDTEALYGKIVAAFAQDWTQYCKVGGPLAL